MGYKGKIVKKVKWVAVRVINGERLYQAYPLCDGIGSYVSLAKLKQYVASLQELIEEEENNHDHHS